MTPQEVVSAASYTVVTPILLYFAFVHWNRQEKRAAWMLGCLSLFFLLMAVGLVLLRYVTPAPILTAAKTLLMLARMPRSTSFGHGARANSRWSRCTSSCARLKGRGTNNRRMRTGA